MKRFLFIAAALLALTSAGNAEPWPTVLHNGSLMQVEQLPDKSVLIRYLQPRPSLWAVGVMPGSVLLHGRWVNDRFEALANVFTRTCGPIPYLVSGAVPKPGGALTLVGAAPVIDPYLCIVLGLTWESDNAKLVFAPEGA